MTENDLISRAKLMDKIDKWANQVKGSIHPTDRIVWDVLEGVTDTIYDEEAIEAEPVRHGRWVWHEDWGHPSISEPQELLDACWMCSTCGTDLLQYLKSHFPDIPSYTECSEEVPTLERCPNCGAKMDGGAEDV